MSATEFNCCAMACCLSQIKQKMPPNMSLNLGLLFYHAKKSTHVLTLVLLWEKNSLSLASIDKPVSS